MTGNSNNAGKRRLRAERRAAEAAAAKAKAEQEAKERRQQTIIGAIATCIILILIAIGAFAIYHATSQNGGAAKATGSDQQSQQATDTQSLSEAKNALAAVSTKPARADDQAGILISKDGYGKKASGAPTVAFYMEPLCPGCASVHRTLDGTLESMIDAGQLNLELHFMTFQDSNSTDEYSTRAFNGALVIAENDDDPQHLLKYLSNIYAEDFQPGELDNYESVSDDQLKRQALDAGVSQEVADKAFDGSTPYAKWLKAADDYTILRTELYGDNGGFSSPTLTINGAYWSTQEPSKAGVEFKAGFLQAIGLSADQVGQAGAMPSIGADGKPLDLG